MGYPMSGQRLGATGPCVARIVAAAVFAAGCSSAPLDYLDEGTDAGSGRRDDAGLPDAGDAGTARPDAGADAGAADGGGPADGGNGHVDAGAADGGPVDAGSGHLDAGPGDGGPADAGSSDLDAGPGDGGAADAGAPFTGLFEGYSAQVLAISSSNYSAAYARFADGADPEGCVHTTLAEGCRLADCSARPPPLLNAGTVTFAAQTLTRGWNGEYARQASGMTWWHGGETIHVHADGSPPTIPAVDVDVIAPADLEEYSLHLQRRPDGGIQVDWSTDGLTAGSLVRASVPRGWGTRVFCVAGASEGTLVMPAAVVAQGTLLGSPAQIGVQVFTRVPAGPESYGVIIELSDAQRLSALP